MIIRELFVLLGFKVDDNSTKQAEAALKDMKALALTVSASVAAVGAVLTKSVLDFAAFAGATKDASEALGVGVETLQEYDYAAKLGGASSDAMRQAMLALGAASAGATEKGKATAKMLATVGVSMRDAGGQAKPANQIFDELIAKLGAIPDAGHRAAVASKVLGSAGKELLPVFAKGSEEFARLRQEAIDLGAVMGEDTVKAGDDLGDNLDRLRVVGVGLSRLVGAGLAPAIDKVVKAVIAWRKENGAFIRVGLGQVVSELVSIINTFVTVGTNATSVVVNIVNAFGGLRSVLMMSAAAFAVWFSVVYVGLIPFALTLAAVAAGFLLIAAIIEDVAMYERYGDEVETLTGRLVKFVDNIKWTDNPLLVMLKMIAGLLGAIASAARAAGQAMSGMADLSLLASDSILGTDLAPIGLRERVNRSGIDGQIRSMRSSGATDQGIASLLGISLDRVGEAFAAEGEPPPPINRSPVRPIVLDPIRINTGRGNTTDARVMHFNITSTDPKDAAAEVAEKLRDNTTLQIVE